MSIIKIVALILSITVLILFSASLVSAHAQESYVYDYADLLTDDEEERLSLLAENEGNQYGISITFLTYDDAEGKSTMEYTDDFYDRNIAAPDGLLFAIDMDNRQVYVNTVGSCIDNISDAEIDLILDRTYIYASDGEYADFFINAMDIALYAYSGNLITESDEYSEPVNPLIPTTTSLIASAAVMIIVAVVLLVIHNKNNRAPSADTYMGSSFSVLNSNTMFMGTREEVLHDYYADNDNGGGGGSSHVSSGGVSHGGGGRGF